MTLIKVNFKMEPEMLEAIDHIAWKKKTNRSALLRHLIQKEINADNKETGE